MRVLYYSECLSLRDGGEVHGIQFLRAIRDLGVDVVHYPEIAAESEGSHRPAGNVVGRGRFQPLKRAVPPSFYQSVRRFVWERKFLRGVVEQVGNREIDVLLYRKDEFYGLPLKLSSRFDADFVLEVNGVAAQERSLDPRLVEHWTRKERMLLARAAQVITVSGVLREMVLERGVESDRVHVVHNGVDTRTFTPELDPRDLLGELGFEGRFVVGYVGYFHSWHRLDILVESFAELSKEHDDIRLLLVGDGPVFCTIEALVRELGLEDRVVLTGSVPHSAVPKHVAALDVAVIPNTIRYCSPLKLFEYMAMGKATVTPDIGSIREIAADGRETIMIRPGDGRELREALMRLYDDPDLRSSIGREARSLVESRYTWKANAEAIRDILEAVAGGADSRRNRSPAGAGFGGGR